ncbi:MAG: hypothetical protein J7515_20190 [Caulobacter sp.]|nr:hypothetical protein [Caulobacter sp.]
MKRTRPYHVTPAQWLAVLAVWGLVGYAALVPRRAEAVAERVKLVACR